MIGNQALAFPTAVSVPDIFTGEHSQHRRYDGRQGAQQTFGVEIAVVEKPSFCTENASVYITDKAAVL